MLVRHEVISASRDFFTRAGLLIQIDAPILTPAAAEGTSTLFETRLLRRQGVPSQSGQLYLEAAVAAFARFTASGHTL